MITRLLFIIGLLSILNQSASSQQGDPNAGSDGSPDLAKLVGELKEDPQGPFESIRWFCADGTINPADEPCDSVGGIRHGVPKDQVVRIGRHYGIYFGQILAGTDFDVFLDAQRFFARAKQYQIEKYLRMVDDGWIMRQARNYEGAVNDEDEVDWGQRFLLSLCADVELLSTQFFLIRDLSRDIPHRQSDTANSIHQAIGADSLPRLLSEIPEESIVWNQLNTLIDADSAGPGLYAHIADMLWTIRTELPVIEPGWRLAMIDLSLELEFILAHHAASWRPTTARGLIEKNYALAKASAGCGYIEMWEWRHLEPYLFLKPGAVSLEPGEFTSHIDAAHRALDWGIAMVRVHCDPVVELFGRFEPLARSFLPDRLRSSVLFSLARSVDSITSKLATGVKFKNEFRDSTTVTRFRGLTPGFAVGNFAVIAAPDSAVSFSSETIYALPGHSMTPATAAGIISAADSVPVSAELLLSQTVGIPCATVTTASLANLLPLSGANVLFAVSPHGQVVLRPAGEMTGEESALAGPRSDPHDKLKIDTDDVDLATRRLVPIDSLDAYGSGRFCGPNTMRLAHLKTIFPEIVVSGFAIPFGVFRNHLDEQMPGAGGSYWTFLAATFDKAEKWRKDGELERVIDQFVLMRLSQLGEAIRSMPVRGGFHDDLRRSFQDVFGAPLGTVPVFIRGDVNIKDVKELNAAGLDPTVLNVISEAAMLQAVKDVWASVFSEPAYEWRRRFLSNPESLYQSVLIQMAVDVEKSGVVTTTGVPTLESDHVTVSFNWGVGGFEAGQRPERYVLSHDGTDMLISPIRESKFAVLSAAGGEEAGYSAAMTPVLNSTERLAIRYVTGVLRDILPHIEGFESGGPYSIEMGFDHGSVWLFQVTPFWQNTRAQQTAYLYELDRDLLPVDYIELEGAFPPQPIVAPPADSLGVNGTPD